MNTNTTAVSLSQISIDALQTERVLQNRCARDRSSLSVRRLISLAAGFLLVSASAMAAGESDEHQCARDSYPTAVIADYVLACMSANGNSFESLHQCSCSIDFISERMDYKTYEKASTVMQVQLDRGQRGLFYRDSQWAKNRVNVLQQIQAESTLRCF